MSDLRKKWILENWVLLFENQKKLNEFEARFFKGRYGQTDLSNHQFNWLNDIAKRIKAERMLSHAPRVP